MTARVLQAVLANPIGWSMLVTIISLVTASEGMRINDIRHRIPLGQNRRPLRLFQIAVLVMLILAFMQAGNLIPRIPFQIRVYGFCAVLHGIVELFFSVIGVKFMQQKNLHRAFML